MKRCRRRAWLALVLAMLFLTACSTVPPVSEAPETPSGEAETAPTESEEAARVFTLPYSRSDSLNPFKMTTRVNRELCGLLYEGLTTPDAAMRAQNALADSVKVSDETVVATLRADAVFSDGSAVTAADVVTSFEAAKKSDGYAALLSKVKSAKASEDDTRTVTFTFESRDPYAAACLCFPVVRVKEDGTVLGSGPYVFDSAPRLTANPQGTAGAITEIRLLDLVDDDSLAKGLEIGNISYFFSNLSDGAIPRVSSATAAVPMNCMVFVGANSARTVTADSGVRQAISLAIDRTAIAETAFAGYALAATTTFFPPFAEGEEFAALSTAADKAAAQEKLTALGYAAGGTTATGTKAKKLSLTLLVCGDNGFKSAMALQIKEQLAAVGIAVSVEEKTFSDYQTAMKRGQYDLYIGEVRLCENMDLSPLLTRGGAAAYGLSSRSEAASRYKDFCAGKVSFAEFTASFAADLPYIPVCFRCGVAAYDRSLTNVSPTAFNVYAGLENWQSGN